ncbi:MAG: 30S ribosomal protein S3 [Deltaproteobacteria bacterium]|nr:30S ribosomal protein S3 [Deltaproteobacteria bacterium]
MGQKIHPTGFRIKVIRGWDSVWFAEKKYGELLKEDLAVRNFLDEKVAHAGISKVVIERSSSKVRVTIHTSRPGIIIGKKGAGIDVLKAQLQKLVSTELLLNIKEVRKAEIDSKLVAENIATQLERRVAFRRAMKKALQSAMKFGAEGIKVQLSGRLAGAEMARMERYMEGRVPLHTLRADIDYGTATARTTYGAIGVKVWIFKGEVLEKNRQQEEAALVA